MKRVRDAYRRHCERREAIHPSSFRDGPKDQTSGAQLRTGESRDSGFDASHRPGMTAKPSLTRLRVPDVEFSQRAGNDKIIVVEHQGPRDAVLEQFERHRINRRLLAVL